MESSILNKQQVIRHMLIWTVAYDQNRKRPGDALKKFMRTPERIEAIQALKAEDLNQDTLH